MFLLSHFLRLIDCKCTLMALKLKTFMFYRFFFALTETDTHTDFCRRQKGRETLIHTTLNYDQFRLVNI